MIPLKIDCFSKYLNDVSCRIYNGKVDQVLDFDPVGRDRQQFMCETESSATFGGVNGAQIS